MRGSGSMDTSKWKYMSKAEIIKDHKKSGGKKVLLFVSLVKEDDPNVYFQLIVWDETNQKYRDRMEKKFDTEDEGMEHIRKLEKNPKYAVAYQPN